MAYHLIDGSGLPSTLQVNFASCPSLTVTSNGIMGNVGRRVTSLRFGDGDLLASENHKKMFNFFLE